MKGLLGIDEIGKDLFIGVGLGLTFIVASLSGLFALSLPPVASIFSTNVGRLLAVGVLAPVIEEVLFRGVLLALTQESTKKFILANALQAIAFGVFHLLAYSGVFLEEFALSTALAVGGAFLSAIIFGFVMGFVAKKTNNLLPGIIAHAIINAYLISGTLFVIG